MNFIGLKVALYNTTQKRFVQMHENGIVTVSTLKIILHVWRNALSLWIPVVTKSHSTIPCIIDFFASMEIVWTVTEEEWM
mmetsp:Transcript_13208/g.19837  ORF Transcript_13208/g.19837 Transcript_13208/m.19837 type:complete len:80 (-) Transcript_13208:206-445(-)